MCGVQCGVGILADVLEPGGADERLGVQHPCQFACLDASHDVLTAINSRERAARILADGVLVVREAVGDGGAHVLAYQSARVSFDSCRDGGIHHIDVLDRAVVGQTGQAARAGIAGKVGHRDSFDAQVLYGGVCDTAE